jgi:hypothetical protein
MKEKLLTFLAFLLLCNMGFSQRGALYFDGVDDYLVIKGNSKLNGPAHITIETWLYSGNFNSSPCADCAPIVWNQGKAYRFGTGNTRVVNFTLNSTSSAVTLSSTTVLSINQWHHIAGTYDGNKMFIYIDGVATDSLASTFTVLYNSSTDDVWIADPVTGWGGILEETRIWNYPRSKKEIQESMIKKFPSSTSGLILSYGYEDGIPYKKNTSVSLIKDNSSNGNDGAINNFKLEDTVSNFVLGRSYCDTAVYSTFNVSQCLKYTMPSKKRTVTKSGTYNDTIISQKGCDSIMTITVTILNSTTGTIIIAACDSFRNPINGSIYKRSGKYTGTTRNVAGCDSVVTFNLTIYKKDTTRFFYNECNSAILKNGKTVIYSGVYVDSLKGFRGCDSAVIHTVTIRRNTYAKVTLPVCLFVICPSNRAKVFYTPGIYYDTLANKASCDSVIEYNVVSASTSGSLSAKACGSFKSPSGKYTYTKSGTYQDTLTGINHLGCDSFISINLVIPVAAKKQLDVSDCRSYKVPSGSRTITNTQQVMDMLKSKDGCDSIEYTINVTINRPNTGVMRNGNVLTAATTNSSAQFQWLNCDAGHSAISGAVNKQYAPGKNGNFAVEVKENNCTDTSVCSAFQMVGIRDLKGFEIVVKPNPSNGNIVLQSLQPLHHVNITISDIQGRVVENWQMPDLKEHTFESKVNPGVYYLRIESEEGIKVLPILFE